MFLKYRIIAAQQKQTVDWNTFKSHFFALGCFDINQVLAWRPGFSHDNLVRWTRRGYIIRLRRGVYAFPEYRSIDGAAACFAGRMYRPSYVSLHSALALYGAIPEAVVQITSVTTLKTAAFKNDFGEFSYKSVREELMFGYARRPVGGGLYAATASLEKALLDLLYLYPEYRSEKELDELRLDEDVLSTQVDWGRLDAALNRIGSKALDRRVTLLRKAYAI